jgi:hypothetical protein
MKFFSRFFRNTIPLLALLLLFVSTLTPTPTVAALEVGALSTKDIATMQAPLAGGWSASKLDDPMVLEAAEFCFQALQLTQASPDQQTPNYSFTVTSKSFPKVIQASQQVVAGMNFRLTILAADDQGACLGAFTATVYNRFGDLSVTTWGTEYSCAEAKTFDSATGDAN